MSTMICLKEAGAVVLATDSRFMNNDFSHVDNDAAQKITQIGETDAFIATSGWNAACDFEVETVCDLSRKLGTDDIRVLGDALNRESVALLQELARVIVEGKDKHARWAETANGTGPLQGFFIAGRAGGALGFVYYEYWIQSNGRVGFRREEYFGAQRGFKSTGIHPHIWDQMKQERSTWTDTAVSVVRRMLAAAKSQAHGFCGGSDQIVMVTHDGARWVSRPEVMQAAQGELCHATITAAISMTIGSGESVYVDPNNTGINVRASNGVTRWQTHGGGHIGYDAAGNSAIVLNNLSKSIMLMDSGFERVFLSAALSEMRVNGQKILGARGAAVASPVGGAVVDVECRAALSELLSRLRASSGHGLIGG